jgi:hypothetical protein
MSEQLDELKATRGENEVNDPVPAAGGAAKGKNRAADKHQSVDPNAGEVEDDVKTPQGDTTIKKAPKRLADKGTVKESVDEMFAGQDLSEEFKDKVTVVFEAAVNEAISKEHGRLEEEYETRLAEETDVVLKDITEKLDTYLDAVVENWLEENSVAIEQGIRSEMAESFLNGLKELFTEHNIDVPEDKIDAIAEMSEEIEQLKAKLDESENTQIELNKRLLETEIKDVFEEVSEGLVETSIEKFRSLTEGLEYKNTDDFKRKISIIKENYFGSKSVVKPGNDLYEEVELEEDVKKVDPEMAGYIEAISKSIRK